MFRLSSLASVLSSDSVFQLVSRLMTLEAGEYRAGRDMEERKEEHTWSRKRQVHWEPVCSFLIFPSLSRLFLSSISSFNVHVISFLNKTTKGAVAHNIGDQSSPTCKIKMREINLTITERLPRVRSVSHLADSRKPSQSATPFALALCGLQVD